MAEVESPSFAQERLLFLHLLDPGDPAYHVTVAVDFRGRLDIAALRQATATILVRHDALRTVFRRAGGQLGQEYRPRGPDLTLVDLAPLPAAKAAAELDGQLTRIARHPFDLLAGPPARWILLRMAADRHALVLATHHIVFDGGSLTIVARELAALYEAYRAGRPPGLAAPPVRYAEVAAAERAAANGHEGKLRYWRERLDGAPARLAVFAPSPAPPADRRPVTARITLGGAQVARLREFARRRGCTSHMIMSAGFCCLLWRYSGQEDIVIGSPVATRDESSHSDIVGMFVNMLPLRVDLSGDPCFEDAVARVRDAVFDGIDHRAVPFERMVRALRPARSATLSPLFQVQLVYQRLPETPRLSGLTSVALTVPTLAAKYELSVTVTEAEHHIQVDFEADPAVSDRSTLRIFAGHFGNLLDAVLTAPRRPARTLALLTPPQRRDAVAAGTGPTRVRPTAASLHGLILAQARRTPDAVAVAAPGTGAGRGHVTYRELTRRAARLTGRLATLGIGTEDRVGVLLDRSVALPVALLGILGTGAAFVPLDPDDPPSRLAWLLTDARIGTVLSSPELRDRLPAQHGTTVVDVTVDVAEPPRAARIPHPEQAAYVMYTSGSTGRPKGVVVPHRGIVNRLLWMQEELEPLGGDDRVLHKTPLTFDVSLCELFWPLLAGGCVVIARPGGHRDGGYLADVIGDEQVSTAYFVPSLLTPFLAELDHSGRRLPALARVVCSGEALSGELRDRFLRRLGARLINLYGPTEASVEVTAWRCAAGEPVRIGSPITNVEAHVLDGVLRPLPSHVAGELHLGGAALARGYLDRPALTAASFVPNPLGGAPGARLYRTGDQARRWPDGTLTYLGRLDAQVKIAGNRIELPEIEEAFRTHHAVADVAVVARNAPAGGYLVGYVVPRRGTDVSRAELLGHLRGRLPAVMVPATVVMLDELPHTASGKVDRKALPEPPTATRAPVAQSPPRDRLERLVAQAWCATVGLDEVGIHDNFFDVGGNSLLLIDLHARLLRGVDSRLSVGDLFRCPTVASLAELVRARPESRATTGRAVDRAAVAVRPSRRAPPPAGRAPHGSGERLMTADPPSGAVAIIGMAGRFPGADDVTALWANLSAGIESISRFPAANPEVGSDPRFVGAEGVLDHVEWFDASFFGYSPREAAIMDPQHRLGLEVAWHAFEDAGYDPGSLDGPVGTFFGAGLSSYLMRNLMPRPDLVETVGGFRLLIHNDKDFAATTLAHQLGLRGPAMAVGTGCSSSLVAVHLACQSLLTCESDLAIAGGASIQVPQRQGYLYSDDSIYSPHGRCRPFDAAADGTVGGSGVAAVVLKRLEDAVGDGDRVHAVIIGSAVNNDGGTSVGYTAPSVDGQLAVIAEALTISGVPADSIGYLEAHGTGTPLGDVIEIEAATKAFRMFTDRSEFCAIGSVKANLGHLDVAAGVTGLIKAALAVKHGLIAPQPNFTTLNPRIAFAETPFHVNTDAVRWRTDGTPRRAGVSSFGIGGTNAHLIVEEAVSPTVAPAERSWQVVAVSARSAAALADASAAVAGRLSDARPGELAEVAATLTTRRAFPYRRAVVCRDPEDAITSLRAPATDVGVDGSVGRARPVVFMFPGQGAQHAGMAAELYRDEPAFAAHVDECAKLLAQDGVEVLAGIGRPDGVVLEQAALFVVEYALARTLIGWGVEPAAMIGHSLGEYTAATVAGALPLAGALRLVVGRARLLEATPLGGMLAVRLTEDELLTLLGNGNPGAVSIAAVNAPESCVLSGPVADLDRVDAALRRLDVTTRRLPSAVAFHSPAVEPALAGLATLAAQVDAEPVRLPWVSTLTGDWVPAGTVVEPAHWVAHLRQPVRFDISLRRLLADDFAADAVLLEVGPATTLSSIVRRHPRREARHVVLSCQAHPASRESQQVALLTAVVRAWTAGCAVDLATVVSARRVRRADCPLYPFQRERHWIDPIDPPGASDSLLPWLRERHARLVEEHPVRGMASYPGLRARLDELCAAIALRYLSAGVPDATVEPAGASLDVADIRRRLRVRPEYTPLLDYLIDVLAEDGVLVRRGDTVAFLAHTHPADPESVAVGLKRDHPEFAGLVDLLRHCGAHYESALADRGAGRAVLYPDGEGDLLRRTLGEDTVEFSVTGRLVRLAAELVGRRAGGSRPLRILEVGAGGGRLTWAVAEAIRGTPAEFVVTDIGRAFVGHLDDEASRRGRTIRTALLDICGDPAGQGFAGNSFDMILGLDVVHATPDVAGALTNLHGLLVPGGTLALIETIAGDRWLNLVWGLTEEWWRGADGRTPLLRPEQWRSAVAAAGLIDPVVLPDGGDTGDAVIVLAHAAAPEAPLITDDLVKRPDLADWAYLPGWRRAAPVTSGGALPRGSVALVFTAGPVGDAVAARLRGHDLRVLTVRPGQETVLDTGNEWTVHTARAGDYQRLVDRVTAEYGPIAVIVHAWNTGPMPAGDRLDRLDETQRLGMFSLLSLTKALSERSAGPTRLMAVTAEAQEVLGGELRVPERSTVHATVKVIPREYPQFECTSVDVPVDAEPDQLADRLVAELFTPAGDLVVAYRGLARWLPSFTPWRLAPAPAAPARPRPGGVYLVCGGLGGIGLSLGEALARLPAAVVLTGRSSFPAREEWDRWLAGHPPDDATSATIRRLRDAEERGGQIVVAAADVTSLPAMRAVVERVVRRFGAVTGVIHAAGVPDTAGVIHRRRVEDTWEAVTAKVRGAFVLEDALRGQPLEFAVYCSSIGAVLHKLKFGEVGYVAGNEFLNAYACYRAAGGDPAVAIAWTDWLEAGMWSDARRRLAERYARPAATSGPRPTDDLLRGLTTAEGVEVFRRVLANPAAPNIVISTQDLDELIARHDAFTHADHVRVLDTMRLTAGSRPRPEGGPAYLAPRTDTERAAVAIWESLLGVDGIGVDDDFFALGGDSLIALRFLARLRAELGVERTVADMFQMPTVAGLLGDPADETAVDEVVL